jgi:hypothetical protein
VKPRNYFIATFLTLALLAQNLPAQNPVPAFSNPTSGQASNGQPAAASPSAPTNVGPAAPSAEPGAIQPTEPGVQPTVQPSIAPPQDAETPPAEPEYGGPAILSRGGTASIRTPSENIKIRPYVSITGSYDSGITPVILNSGGNVVEQGSAGIDLEFGLNGYHRWRTATLGIDYKGVYRNYTTNTYYNGTDQTLGLIFQKPILRWSIQFRRSRFFASPYPGYIRWRHHLFGHTGRPDVPIFRQVIIQFRRRRISNPPAIERALR